MKWLIEITIMSTLLMFVSLGGFLWSRHMIKTICTQGYPDGGRPFTAREKEICANHGYAINQGGERD